jgi:hypothetical protein
VGCESLYNFRVRDYTTNHRKTKPLLNSQNLLKTRNGWVGTSTPLPAAGGKEVKHSEPGFEIEMVVLHIKRSDADSFLVETTISERNDDLIRRLVSSACYLPHHLHAANTGAFS